jgi:hypothetical protein
VQLEARPRLQHHHVTVAGDPAFGEQNKVRARAAVTQRLDARRTSVAAFVAIAARKGKRFIGPAMSAAVMGTQFPSTLTSERILFVDMRRLNLAAYAAIVSRISVRRSGISTCTL